MSESTTYESWLKNKTEAQQDSILGKGKAELWRKGEITFRDMLDQTGRPLTLRELQDKISMPETIRAINRKRWSQSFKDKTIEVYNEFAEHGLEIEAHAAHRYLERFSQHPVREIAKGVLNTEPNYFDELSSRNIWYFEDKNLAVIRSTSDDKVITFTPHKRAKNTWKKLK